MTEAKDIAAMPFEQAMKALEEIVARLEKGDIGLEDSIAAYERGEALKKRCEELLKQAETRIVLIAVALAWRERSSVVR